MLSKELTRKFGKGFSRANIWNMITFYKEYGSVQTLSERLSWSHYCELLSISDKDKRHFYEVEQGMIPKEFYDNDVTSSPPAL